MTPSSTVQVDGAIRFEAGFEPDQLTGEELLQARVNGRL
jgi:hypothetical protein